MSAEEESAGDTLASEMDHLKIGAQNSSNGFSLINSSSCLQIKDGDDGGVQITCFSDFSDDLSLHFQIIRLPNQIYAWIGCNSSKFGHLYAAAPTRPNNTVGVASLLTGASDNTGSVLKTGLNVILACNIPKDSPMLEVNAEKKLVQKLIDLGYTRPKYK